MTLLELDATEKCSDILWAVKEENEKELLVISEELQCVKDVIVGHRQSGCIQSCRIY